MKARKSSVRGSRVAFATLRSILDAVWKDVLDFAGTQPQADAVYQVNLQLFPPTREKKEWKWETEAEAPR